MNQFEVLVRNYVLAAGALGACALIVGCAAAASSSATASVSAPASYPSDAGMLNVKDFGAKGDGVTDDTVSILAAIAASGADTGPYAWQDQIVYFPNGTYIVSSPLIKKYANGNYASGMVLIGQSQAGTILRLADHASGYQSTSTPKAIIFTSSKLLDPSGPTGGGKNYTGLGEGNDAYKNSVENMTVETGLGNPGAIGIDYLASNSGAIRNVTVTTVDATGGATGIAMTRKWIGPALLDHVTVNGFSVGIDCANTVYGVTLNHVFLNGQTTAGLRNSQNAISTNDLEVNSIGPAIITTAADGQIVLAQAQLNSQAATTVQATLGTIVFRESLANNYQTFTHAATQGGVLDGVLVGPSTWTTISNSQFIPVADAPALAADPIANWVSVTKFGAVPIATTDATGAPVGTPSDSLAAFNMAFASGAATIYLPHGVYYISRNLVIPDTVKHIVGMNSTIRVYQVPSYQMNRAQGMLRLTSTSTSASPIQIDNLALDNSNYGTQLGVEHSSPRTLVMQDMFFAGTVMLNRSATGGPVFLSDTNSGPANVIAGPAPVTAVQLDMETTSGGVLMTNSGADLNILGLKTEGVVTAVAATGGRTQVLGGLIYMVTTNTSPSTAAFTANNAVLTASFVEEATTSTTHYMYYLSEMVSGSPVLTPQTGFGPRDTGGFGKIVPFLQTLNH